MSQNKELEIIFLEGNASRRFGLQLDIDHFGMPESKLFRTLFDLGDYLGELPKDKRLLFIIGDEIEGSASNYFSDSLVEEAKNIPYKPHLIIEGIKSACKKQEITSFKSVVWTDGFTYHSKDVDAPFLYCHEHNIPVVNKVSFSDKDPNGIWGYIKKELNRDDITR